ncbi:hypothetical protein RQP46_008692 [Phenoliferia psychrophenolica]
MHGQNQIFHKMVLEIGTRSDEHQRRTDTQLPYLAKRGEVSDAAMAVGAMETEIQRLTDRLDRCSDDALRANLQTKLDVLQEQGIESIEIELQIAREGLKQADHARLIVAERSLKPSPLQANPAALPSRKRKQLAGSLSESAFTIGGM